MNGELLESELSGVDVEPVAEGEKLDDAAVVVLNVDVDVRVPDMLVISDAELEVRRDEGEDEAWVVLPADSVVVVLTAPEVLGVIVDPLPVTVVVFPTATGTAISIVDPDCVVVIV